MKAFRAVAAVLIAAMFLVSGVRAADVLDQVPGNAMVVVKIRDLKTTSQKVAEFATALGIVEFSPDLADPLGSIQKKHKMEQGLNTAGDAALAFLDPGADAGMAEKMVVALLPVSDYKAFIGNFADAKTDGDVTTATTPQGETIHIANWGSFAAITPNKDLLAKKP